MAFRFRQFSVEDMQSTLRVGTDAMLLGSWAHPGKAKKILDIGTGCGVLALMMAQKSQAIIEAIDIDQLSIAEAQTNFSKSPWASRITAKHDSLQTFSSQVNTGYEFIITNPPYFSNSLKSPSSRNNNTRHDESLSLIDLVQIASRLLTSNGRFTLILPAQTAGRFQMICSGHGLSLSRQMVIFPRPHTPAKRVLMEFSTNSVEYPFRTELTILDSYGSYTPEYLALTQCYHNF